MKLLFITVFAVLGVSVCPGQTLADILNSQYDDNPIPTVPVEYTLPRLAAKAPFVQLFNSLLLATGHRVFHSDEYEADEYILMRIKAEDLEIEMSGSFCRYPHESISAIGWLRFHGKSFFFSGDNPGLFTPTEETRCFRYKDYPENSLYGLEDDDRPEWYFLYSKGRYFGGTWELIIYPDGDVIPFPSE